MSTGPAVPAYSATLGSFNGCTPAPARPLPLAAPRTKSTSPPTPLTITSGFQSRRRTGSRAHLPRRQSATSTSAAQASSPTRRHMGTRSIRSGCEEAHACWNGRQSQLSTHTDISASASGARETAPAEWTVARLPRRSNGNPATRKPALPLRAESRPGPGDPCTRFATGMLRDWANRLPNLQIAPLL